MKIALFLVGTVIGLVVGRMSKKDKKVSGQGTGHSGNEGGENHNDHVKPSK